MCVCVCVEVLSSFIRYVSFPLYRLLLTYMSYHRCGVCVCICVCDCLCVCVCVCVEVLSILIWYISFTLYRLLYRLRLPHIGFFCPIQASFDICVIPQVRRGRATPSCCANCLVSHVTCVNEACHMCG